MKGMMGFLYGFDSCTRVLKRQREKMSEREGCSADVEMITNCSPRRISARLHAPFS